ncbi:MAG: hypothetical protein U0360_11750 [Dehalococcoidia bacterium]
MQFLALYLMTNPHANAVGLYYLPPAYVSADTGLAVDAVMLALEALEAAGFAKYDRASSTVWVVRMLAFQYPDLGPNDKRIVQVRRVVAGLMVSPFLSDFVEVYGKAYGLTNPQVRPEGARDPEGATAPRPSPVEALRKPLPSPSQALAKPLAIPSEAVTVHVQAQKQPQTSPPAGEEAAAPLPSALVELWHSSCPSLPRVLKLTRVRAAKVRRCLQERPLPEWRRVFERLEQSSFARGDNSRAWRASFDWIIAAEDNAIKVLEGKYDGQTTRPRSGSTINGASVMGVAETAAYLARQRGAE